MTTKTHTLVFVWAIACILCLGSGRINAQGNVGFGIVLGEPTGIAWKYRMNSLNAIAGTIGFSPYDRFRLNVDYLWNSHPFSEERLALHYGFGVAIGLSRTDDERAGYFYRTGELGFGARTVIGLTYMISRSPLDTFLEVAPLFIFGPSPDVGIDIGLGVRAYP